MTKRISTVYIFALILLSAISAFIAYADWFWRIDAVIYDFVTTMRGREPSAEIVIVAIDEQSLAELGKWAWPRRYHGKLVRRLHAAGARAIAFDIAFAETDPDDPDGDTAFAEAIQEHGHVVLPVLASMSPSSDQIVEQLPTLQLVEAGAHLAHVDVELDRDGVARSVFLKAGAASPHWPALSMALLEASGLNISLDDIGERRPKNNEVSPFLWVRDKLILVPLAGPPGSFPRISYSDVISGKVAAESLRDKLVLVGSTATGLGDRLITPFRKQGREMSGVEFQANVVDALLKREVLYPANALWKILFAGGFSGLVFVACGLIRKKWLVLLAAVGAIAALTIFALYYEKIWLPPSAAFIGVAVATSLQIGLARRAKRRRLLYERERADVGLKSIHDAVIMADNSGGISFMNPTAEKLTGYSAGEAYGVRLEDILDLREGHTGTPLVVSEIAAKHQANKGAALFDATLFSISGQAHSVRGSVAYFQSSNSAEEGVVLALNDVTDLRRLAHSIEYQATHDPLTELPNREYFEKLFSRTIDQAVREGTCLTLVLVHIDQLKDVRVLFGRETSNELVRALAARLASLRPDAGLIARVSADDFAISYAGLAHEDAAMFLARKVKNTLEAPLDIAGFRQDVTVSIGVGVFPRDANDARTLVARTEIAVGQAKRLGGGKISHVVDGAQISDIRQARAQSDLRTALKNGQFIVCYQPIYSLRLDQTIGVEALVRRRTPNNRLAGSVDLKTFAEDVELAALLAEWTLSSVGKDAAGWVVNGQFPLRVSVNLSPEQFVQRDLPLFLEKRTKECGLKPSDIAFEITERTLLRDMEIAKGNMNALLSKGFQIVVDDFGVGYTSLVYLRNLPISGLKIHKSYVQGALLAPEDAAIIRAIIAMAHSMGLTVIGDGVARREQFEFLRNENCDEVQGDHIGKPVPPNELMTFFAGRKGHRPL